MEGGRSALRGGGEGGDFTPRCTALLEEEDDAAAALCFEMPRGTAGLLCGHTPFLQLLQCSLGSALDVVDAAEAVTDHHGTEQLLWLEDGHHRVGSTAAADQIESCVTQACAASPPAAAAGRRKRPRPRRTPAAKRKRPEQVAQGQRAHHIAVERNRRRLMNDHLAALRSLIPPSLLPRGDQATVVAGAIEYIKELEHRFVTLRARAAAAAGSPEALLEGVLATSGGTAAAAEAEEGGVRVEAMAAAGGHVRVTVVAGRRRPAQLAWAVAAVEELRLAVLHLYVVSLGDASVLYALNLKMEEGCRVGAAEEVATVVHQIFGYTGGPTCQRQ